MKARIKATGEIGIVTRIDVLLKDDFVSFSSNKVEILQNYADATIDPDYWTRLEHQAAIAAMQGTLSDPVLLEATLTNAEKFDFTGPQAVAIVAYHYAHALVEKMKEEREG